MQNFIIKYIFISILFYSCTDILLNDDPYNSIHLKGGGWITFDSNDIATIFNNDFSFWKTIEEDLNHFKMRSLLRRRHRFDYNITYKVPKIFSIQRAKRYGPFSEIL